MAKLTFYPIGNADSTLIHLADDRLVLLDFCNSFANDHQVDLTQELLNYLKRHQRKDFDVVAFTHADGDHVEGAEDFFYFEHGSKYQSETRIKIKELWVPACFILDTELCESARVIRQEARYRLQSGTGIRVFGNPEILDDWLISKGIPPVSRQHLITHAGNCIPGFTKSDGQVEIFCHSPFSIRMQDDPYERNDNSIVLHLTFFEGNEAMRCMMGADAEYQTWVDIVTITEKMGNSDRLEWDLFHISHHCSYTGLSAQKGILETSPQKEIEELFNRGSMGCLLISPSKPIPSLDTDQPPHRQAAAFYKRIARERGSAGNFVVTMAWPSSEAPRPVVVETSINGLILKRDYSDLAGISVVTHTPSPRFGLHNE